MVAEVTHGHPSRVHRDDLVVEAIEAGLPLLDDPELELTGAVAGNVYMKLPAFAFDGLVERVIAGVAGVFTILGFLLIAEVVGEFGSHNAFYGGLRYQGWPVL